MSDFETAKQFFLEGLRFLEANDLPAAEMQFARSLEIMPERVSTLNNLSAIKIKLDKFEEAEEFARKAIALDDKSPEAWSNLGIALTATGRPEEALRACDRAINYNPSSAMAWLAKAKTLLELKRFDEALLAGDEAQKLEPNKYEILYHKSLILKELNRPDEAQKIYRESLDMRVASSPVFIGDRHPTQKADVLIISRDPDLDGSLVSFENLRRYCENFPGQLADHIHEEFHFTYVALGDATPPSTRKQIPQPDFVINNNVNGEFILSEGNLPVLIELFDGFGVPVVNHPTKAVLTARDTSVKLLEGVPGIVVPKTRRFSSVGKTCGDLVREIEEQYEYPLITRSLMAQMGKGMTKADSREALVGVLATGCPKEFFVTEFIDSRRGKEFYRKIRAVVINDEIIIARVDYDTFWNVHGRKTEKRVPFYLENAYLLEQEKWICQDPEAGLGRSAVQSLRMIRERIPMDVFGIDFAVGPDGLLVFYEANATMNLFSTANKLVPNPEEVRERLKLAFQRYFTSLVVRR